MCIEVIPNGANKETIQLNQLVVIIMGSEKDRPHTDKMMETLNYFGVCHTLRVASAHKTPEHALAILEEYNGAQIVFIAVAGRSNALGGFIDGNTTFPVINAPPSAEPQTIFSSLEMPSGIGAATVLYPEAAALHAVKILALSNHQLAAKYKTYQENLRQTIYDADNRNKIP